MRKVWDLIGGVHVPENKQQSVQSSIGTLPMPRELVIPLNQHIGAPPKLLVAEGEKVLKGQVLAEPKGFVSAGIHAPTSGVISAISDHPIPHPSGMAARCLTLIPDGDDRWIEIKGLENYREHGPEKLLNIIRQSGIAGMGGAGFPTAVKLSARQPISTLIINGTECEPYITADDMLMRERPQEIVEGIKILAYILGEPDEILIGIENNKPEAYEALEPYLKDTNIELVEFQTRYPSGGEKQLIQILTGKEVPNGGLPADVGIVCQNIGTTYAVKQAIQQGEPLISRVTTVAGKACQTNRNYQVLIGTPISHLLEHNGFDKNQCPRLVMGGPMMGFTLEDLNIPVVKTTNCILAPTAEELPTPPPAQACIRCGMCAEACPASLLPQQLFWYAQSQNHERLEAHNLFDCIECGACSYVCPSNIPLVQYYRAAKGDMRKLAQEKINSDRARERFEFQKARKEKEEAAKLAKREARKKAAEQARAKAAANAEGSTEGNVSGKTASSPADDIIKAAMARAEAQKASPEEQREKLKRGITRIESHLESVQRRLNGLDPEATDKQREQALAAVEDAQLRLKDARQKLADLKPPSTRSTSDNTASSTASSVEKMVMEKIQDSPREALEKKIATLKKRIAVTEEKLAEADDESLKTALQNGLEKQQTKLNDTEQQLTETPDQQEAPAATPETEDAATAAIARAQAKAAAQASMSDEDKLKATVESLQNRLKKAQEKLTSAEAEGSEHIDAFRTGVEKLQAKLTAAEAQLQQDAK
jgi:H+/Na+-translocating ferredoxin:NAD+ oxidoreductase subunit C